LFKANLICFGLFGTTVFLFEFKETLLVEALATGYLGKMNIIFA